MGKRILLLVVIAAAFLFFMGCSVFQVKREVTDNTLVSNTPNVKFRIDPEFQYVGNPHKRDTSESVGGRELDINFDSYCFVKPDDAKASKVISIQFHRVETYFVSDFFRKVEALQKGAQDVAGKSFQYYMRGVQPSMNSHMTRMITDKGYSMPYGLVKVFGRIYGPKGNMLVKLYYYESLDGSGLEDLAWKNYDNLSRKQQDYLEKFSERADASFELLD